MSYSKVSAKLGNITSSTKSISKELYDAASKAGHAPWYMWGKGSSSEHATGRALDLMVRSEADGDWIRNYIWKHRKRLRLQHVIWEQHITSTVTSPGRRRKMGDRGSVTENHMDHVHVLFFSGSYRSPGKDDDSSSGGKKSVKTVALEVIAGEWGNGDTRKDRLRRAGYDYEDVQREVNKQLGDEPSKKKSVKTLATEVLAGKWGNGETRKSRLRKAGYDYEDVQKQVEKMLDDEPKRDRRKSVKQLASEVIAGKWGNGDERRSRLKRAGYDANDVQREVNRKLGASSGRNKSVSTLAREVIAGEWGNGAERVRRLRAAGYSSSAVQREVNRRL